MPAAPNLFYSELDRSRRDIVRGKNLPQEEAHVKHLSVRLGLAVLLAVGLITICSHPAAAQDAAATYKAKCAMCHGPDGKGGKMGTRDFASAEVKAESDAQLTEIITKGKPPKMPAYGEKLKDTEIKDLVAYIRGLGK
jgi:mono/diheme cytochrome c family protein